VAHVPLDDARQLFFETNPKTWSQFRNVLRQHKGKVDGISDTLIDLMMEMVPHFEETHEAFPGTPEQLQNLLNRRLAETGHKGVP
jgi:hypothetical protein